MYGFHIHLNSKFAGTCDRKPRIRSGQSRLFRQVKPNGFGLSSTNVSRGTLVKVSHLVFISSVVLLPILIRCFSHNICQSRILYHNHAHTYEDIGIIFTLMVSQPSLLIISRWLTYAWVVNSNANEISHTTPRSKYYTNAIPSILLTTSVIMYTI